MKKIIVNSNCIGCGACTSFCDVFKFNDEGLATTDENKNIIDNTDKKNAMNMAENFNNKNNETEEK